MEFEELHGVWTANLSVEEATITVIAGESRCLLVDTGFSPDEGTRIRAAIQQITDLPLEVVVLTHGHWDHAFGLGAFSDLDTIGHENLVTDIQCRENTIWAKKQRIPLLSIPTPETLIGVIAVRDLGNLSVEIAHFGHAHTSSDLIIAVPDRNVVIVGDLVEAGPPQFDEATSIHGWVAALDCLHSILKPDMTVICGHGTPLTADHVTKFRAGLAAIWDQSEWAFNQGMTHAGA
ncbi:MAG: MBL fold metallo-hydrolase, partial [Propionibacteriaceae bacterium]|nr:MBL fold metallo-hydrolase [Propionibacteriaceae bacterium]